MTEKVKSPCIGRCSCTLGDDVCKGCGRTADQVRDWNGYSDKQKAEVLRVVENDKRTFG